MSPAAVKSETPDLDKFRDELAEAHKPADGYERMLVSEIAQAWFCLENAAKSSSATAPPGTWSKSSPRNCASLRL